MSTKQFYLLGEVASSAREIDLPPAVEFEELQSIIASHFAIVKPNSVGFLHDDRKLNAVSEVLEVDGPVAVSISGNAVQEVPGPAGIPYFGNYLEIYPDHLGNHQRLFEKYGPLFTTNSMGNRLYQTNSAELSNIFLSEDHYFTKDIVPGHPLHPIKNQEAGVFLADTDTEQWRLAHKFLPPALGPKAVRHYAPTMQRTVESSFKVFDELDEKGEAWNVYQYMLKLGSQAVGKLVLGMDFAHFEQVDSPLHEMVLKIAENLELNKRVSSMGAWYAKMPFGDPKKVRQTMDRIMEMMDESIARASKGQEDLELQDAALKADNVVDYFLRATDNKGNKLPPSQFAPALLVATAAGFTTTSSLLSWLIYSLVKYPGNQERLLQELIDNDWDEDTQVTAETTSKLTFLDKFIKETQRLHNPSFQPGRTAKVDMILPGGYRLPKGAVVISALHHMHNNKDVWENPGRFDPDRWDTEQVKNRPPGSYIPFATGPRMCVGFNFALQEIKVFLPKLVYRYKFTLAQDGPIEYDPYFQLIRPNNFTWETEFITSRHVHNRGSRKPKSQTANISNIFGVYEIQCAKAESIAPSQQLDKRRNKTKRQPCPTLIIQCFTPDEHGLVGSLHIPGVLDAKVHMSGSRRKLQEILDAEDASNERKSNSEEEDDMESDHQERGSESEATCSNIGHLQHPDATTTSYGAELTAISAPEDREQSRFKKFEKNTFRQPKFWLFWKGIVLAMPGNTLEASEDNSPDTLPNEPKSGMGYVVFSGNRYEKLKGTISCELLGWKNVAISGRKQ
ncbi:cytochrome p450 oxidoreductase [Fusarium longipes]|uniref:Cytochrome p450 oxidoreductase n=1 Tax=Fusarium longipes TaxID=694270 RepID=A0A395SM65_9HYPO|nr:cytochrome p450 oxidoreductase [Fusarium longipes]